MGTVFGYRHALKSSGLAGRYRACPARRFAGARCRHLRSSSLGAERGQSAGPGETGPMAVLHRPEGRAMEALADRIIPPDPQTPGGKDAGCAVFVDRQLAGPYGRQEGLYNRRRSMNGTKSQGPQSEDGPAQKYREALAALDRDCQCEICRQGIRRSRRQPTRTRSCKGLESGRVQARRRRRQGVLRAGDQGRADGFLRRSDLRRQSRHGRRGR